MTAPAPPANLNPQHQAISVPSSSSSPSSSTTSRSSLPIEYASFPPPLPESTPLPSWTALIEFCDRCRWLHRATWVQTELFLTFGEKDAGGTATPCEPAAASPPPTLKSVMLLPMTRAETAGRFRVWLYGDRSPAAAAGAPFRPAGAAANRAICVYDRKVKGGFPELKELKQLIRDVISPGQSLGHSDKKGTPSLSQSQSQGTGLQGVSGTGHEPNTGTATTD